MVENKKRFSLFLQSMELMDEAYDLMYEYDSLPHKYGAHTLYQAESHIIQAIGKQPGITVTDLAAMMNKTASACSQIVRKLREKKWVTQTRNEGNNREYKLDLTEHGWSIFESHEKFDQACFERSCAHLNEFTDQELETYLMIQRRINDAFRLDVAESRESFTHIPLLK